MSLLQTFFKIEPGRIPAPPTGTPFEKQREITRAQIARTTAFRPIAEKFKTRGHTSRAAAEAERDRILAAHPGIDLRIAEYSPINMDSLFNLIPAATAQRRNSKDQLKDRVFISNPILASGIINPGNHADKPQLRKITIMASSKQTASTAFDVSTANGPALVAEFNRLAALLGVKSVNKFADRKTAQKRVADAAAKVAALAPAPKAKAVKADKPAKVAKAKVAKAPVDRAAAIAKSWLDPQVAAKRAERDGVVVDKVEYRSVAHAFTELGLPMGKHIAFRMQLKAEPTGKLAIAGKVFKLVKAAE